MLDQVRLLELLHYNGDIGEFTWRVSRRRQLSGSIAGFISGGYKKIKLDGVQYYSHRLVWLYVHGYFPEHYVDHINRDPMDNRICNLREVSPKCSSRNVSVRRDNTSKIPGVSWDKNRESWIVHISNGGMRSYIGRFKDFTEAVCYRLAAEQCLDWGDCGLGSPAYEYVNNYFGDVTRR